MAVSERIFWKIYAGVIGTATTMVAQKLVTKAWEASTGDEPPDPNDPDTPLVHAIIWAVASGLGVGMAQMTMNRYMQKRWNKNMGHGAPGRLKNKLDLDKK